MKLIFIVLFCFVSVPSNAYIASDFDANWGVSFIDVKVAGIAPKAIESYSTLEIGYNLIFSSINTALNISFMELVNSNFGLIPFTRLAFGPRYYVRGLNGTRLLLDNQVQGRLWRPSPFIGFQLGFSSLSIEDTTSPQFQNNFNAAIVDANIELGLETPISSDWLLMGQFSYLTSVLSNSGDERPELSYEGLQILIGLKITKF